MIDEKTILDLLKSSGPLSVVTFILGFLLSRYTLTKKDSQDIKQKRFENSRDMKEKLEERFQELATALNCYINSDDADFEEFYAISTAGEKYIYQMRIVAEAIISKNVDDASRDNTFVPKIKDAIERTIPDIYETLNKIARKKSFKYNGKFKKQNYEGLYTVVEKYYRG